MSLRQPVRAWPGVRLLLCRRPRLSAFLAGGVSTLAMPPLGWWPLLFATLPALAVLVDDVRTGAPRGRPLAVLARAAMVGWLFGFGYFLLGIYWISASLFVEPDKHLWLLPLSASALPAGLALFFALGTAIAAALWRPGLGRATALAVGLAVSEWLRGHVLTGFPWNTLGYAMTSSHWLMQSAALLGIWGLTLVTVLVATAPGLALQDGRRRSLMTSGAAALVVGALAAFGALRLAPVTDVAGVRLRILQPNISQDVKWRFANRAAVFAGYLARSRRDGAGREDGLAGITHLIWPESAVPFLLLDTPDALAAIADLLPERAVLVTGAIRLEPPRADDPAARRRVFNSILAIDQTGALAARYDKVHLVPFGEYVPLRGVLDLIGLGGLTPAAAGFDFGRREGRALAIPGLPLAAPLVCYEIIFPGEVLAPGQRPGLLLNVTNDGWFRNTAGPHQHLHQARVRAVELGLPLVRSANTGISAVVDPYGRVVHRLALGTSGVIDSPLPGAISAPPYARWGDAVFWLLLGLATGVNLAPRPWAR